MEKSMTRLDQPLPDRCDRPVAGDYKMQRPLRGGAYVPREVPTIDPREVAAYAAAWDGLDDDSIAAGAAMSANPAAYLARVLAARGAR
jgi:hypothetical protein